MSELPTGWAESEIQEQFFINLKIKPELADDENVSFIPMTAVSDKNGKIENESIRLFSEVKKGYTQFVADDVIFAKVTPCMENGKSAVVRDLVNNIGYGSTEFFVFRPKGGYLPELFHRLVRQSSFRKAAKKVMSGAVGLLRVPKDYMATFKLNVPPLNEQKRIIARLKSCESRITAAREPLDEVPALLEQYRQSILAAAFRGDLTKDWRAANPKTEHASELLTRIRIERRIRWEEAELAKYADKGKAPPKKWKEKYTPPEPLSDDELSKMFALPEGWIWAAAEEVVAPLCNIIYGIIQPGKKLAEGIPYVRGKDIVDGVIQVDQLLKTSPEIAKKYERASLKGGDVLLGIIRATKVAVVPDVLEGGNITQGTARFRPSSAIGTDYLAIALKAPQTQNWLHAHYRGIDMPGLNLRDVRRAPIALPPLKEQQEIASIVRQRFQSQWQRWTQEVATSIAYLDQLNQSLFAKAFRGELVPQDPSDESASILLERVKEEHIREQGNRKKAKKKPPNARKKRVMKKQEINSVLETLEANKEPMSSEVLFERCGYPRDAETKTVEAFFVQIRDALKNDLIARERRDETDYFSIVD